jgi:hypothetical protein
MSVRCGNVTDSYAVRAAEKRQSAGVTSFLELNLEAGFSTRGLHRRVLQPSQERKTVESEISRGQFLGRSGQEQRYCF